MDPRYVTDKFQLITLVENEWVASSDSLPLERPQTVPIDFRSILENLPTKTALAHQLFIHG